MSVEFKFGNRTYEIAEDGDPYAAIEVMTKGGSLYDMWFGAVGTTRILVWAAYNEGFEGAFEIAVGELGPGYFTPDDEIRELVEEAQAEGLDEEEAFEQATTDLTYSEAGWIPSWEWGGNEIHVSPGAKYAESLVWEAFNASLNEAELDEDEWEDVDQLLKSREK